MDADNLDALLLYEPDGQERIESAGEQGKAAHATVYDWLDLYERSDRLRRLGFG